MLSSYCYSGLNKQGKEIKFAVEIEKSLGIDKDADFDIMVRGIVANAFEFIEELAKNKSTIHIAVTGFNQENADFEYKIIEQADCPVHHVAFKRLKLNKQLAANEKQPVPEVEEIIARRVVPVDKSVEKIGPTSLLERFSEFEKVPRSLFDRAKNVLAAFFSKILYQFRFLEKIWFALTHQTAKDLDPIARQLKWDLSLLAEICGTVPTDGMTMLQSLTYLSKMLERDEIVDPELKLRFEKAVRIAQVIVDIRNNYHPIHHKNLITNIQRGISKIEGDTKVIFPVGYFQDNQLVEGLLELSKDPNGKYRVVFISTDERTRNLFDREAGVQVGSQSIRREITHVELAELMAAIPTLIELQSSPTCLQDNGSTWRDIFMQTVRFDRSQVEVSQTTERYSQGQSLGRFGEVMAYVKGEQSNPIESKRFDLAIRLRLFLDICKRNEAGFKDPVFWKAIRTTAHHLAALIDQEKSILGSKDVQGVELTRIYGNLKQLLDKLDRSPPELTNLQTKLLPLTSGNVEVETHPNTPSLAPLRMELHVYPKINPQLAAFDSTYPDKSITDWGLRCRAMIGQGKIEEAACEAKLMAQMLPKITDPYWANLTEEQATDLLNAFNDMGEAIARGAVEKEPAPIQDIFTITLLNYYAISVAARLPFKKELTSFIAATHKIGMDLANCRLTTNDRSSLSSLQDNILSKYRNELHLDQAQNLNHLDHWDDEGKSLKKVLEGFRSLPRPVQIMLNMNQFITMTMGLGSGLSATVNGNLPLRFKVADGPSYPDSLFFNLEGNNEWEVSFIKNYKTPLALRAPSYAFDVSKEISSHYVTEYCCLGCISDNCPNYGRTPKEIQRFHTLYMLHNYVDVFCNRLGKRGQVHRDELADLMYTQQTNQNARDLSSHHGLRDGFDIADGFNSDDRCHQFHNAFMAYLEHPHFFKYSDLRWLFENKIFTYGVFNEMLSKESISEHKPFLISAITKLKKEIAIANASGDKEIASYLFSICEEIKEKINDSTMDIGDKNSLLELLPKDGEAIISKWAEELIGKNDEYLLGNQLMIFPLILQKYYKKFIQNPNDPSFESDTHLEMILSAAAHIESNEKLKKNIDPEVYDRCRSLLSWVLNKTKAKIEAESEITRGSFINKLLFRINPPIASLQLKWDSANFPTFLAKDDKGKPYQFDLITGKTFIESQTAAEIPDNIKSDPALQRLFGKTLNENWNVEATPPESSERIIAYKHNKFPNFRIVVKRSAFALASSKPKIIIERTIQQPNNQKKWITYAEFDTLNRLKKNEKFSETPDLPVAIAIAIGDRTCWVDRTKKMIYVFEEGVDELYATMALEPNGPYWIDRMTEWYSVEDVRVKSAGLPSKDRVADLHIVKEDVHLLSAKKEELERFASIENPQFITVLGRKNQAKTINYQRYEMSATGACLSYDIGTNGITCKAFPKYFLAAHGTRPGSADPAFGVATLPSTFDNFHLFQKDGDEKVLIPLCGFEQQFALTGDPLPISKIIFSDEFEKCQIYEFSVDKETNRLIAKSGDAYAYLAYVCMAHQDYESATYYLSKARTTAGYGDQYNQIFQWVEKWTDVTPEGIAMKLRFNLFREKVSQDNYMHQIREGMLQKSEEIAMKRASRLIEIAELYEKYIELRKTRKAGESGLDPALDLELEEEQQVRKSIQSLLESHGDRLVESNEPRPLRAAEIPLQIFASEEEGRNPLGISKGALLLWMFNSTARDFTVLTVKDPRWIIQNFRNLFNQILTDDINSVHYKQLKHQIRIISELPKNHLNIPETQGMIIAQSYLLKLMTAKESNLAEFQQLQRELGLKKSLDPFVGPFFNKSRVNAIARMTHVLEIIDVHALASPNQAEKIAQTLMQRKKNDPYDTRTLGKNVLKFISRWKVSQKPPFDESFRQFLINEIYGPSGSQGINALDKVFSILNPIEIVQPKQTIVQQPLSPQKQPRTFIEKFGKLIESKRKQYKSAIDELEAEIALRLNPEEQELVETKPEHIHAVIGDATVAKYRSDYFTVTEAPTTKISQKIFDELGQSKEKAYVRVAERHRADLNAYLATIKTSATIKKGAAETLRGNLVAERERLSNEEETLKRDLLQYVELFDTPAGILALRRLIGKGVKPSLSFLIALWRRGETAKSWQNHPFNKLGMKEVRDDDLKKLDTDIARYLELCTAHNHFNRLIDMSDNYLKSCKENDPLSYGDSQLANELFEGVQVKRNYSLKPGDDADYRDLLYVEYTQKIIMYSDQIKTFREMSHDPNAVRQLRMGRGKTEVIMPILAKKKANGKNLVVLMLPEELYEANCRSLDIKNRVLFGQDMQRFEFSRKTDTSIEAMEKIHLSLLETIRDKGFIVMTKHSLLCLKDSYVFLLNRMSELKPHEDKTELLGQIRAMSKVVSLFYNQGDILADEVDACLDVRKEVNFALGESEKIDQIKGDVVAELMQIILDQKPNDPLHELRDALLHNTQAALSPNKRTLMLETLVSTYFDQHREQLTGIEKAVFIKYIMNDPSGIAAMKWVFTLKEKNEDLFKRLTTLKAVINQGIGVTLGRVGNVNYGRDPVSGVNTIPYKASNAPSINSEFDDDIERISFTYQDYLQNGVSYKQVYQIVAQMQNRAFAEMRSSPSDEFINILDMQAAKEFQDFLREIDPERKLPASINLASMHDPKMIGTLVRTINSSPKGLLVFCHKQVVGKMRQFSAQINAMSTEVPELVKNFGGFTGTPWNIHTYHDKINAKESVGVDGTTWALMLGRDVSVKTFNFNAESPIDSLLSGTDIVGDKQAVVDTGAYLRGASNVEFIDRVLEIASKEKRDVEAGIYFDAAGKIVKKQKVDDKPLPIEIAPATDLMGNVTLYDQAHTVGADIRQGKKATAVVTIGENTFIRDLFQAVWRLRQLHLEQSVVLALSSKIKARILEGQDREFTQEEMRKFCDEIHKFCLMNETRREAEDNFKAEKEKIQGCAKRQLLATIAQTINNNASDGTIIKMSEKFAGRKAGIFIKTRAGEEAYDQYGQLKTLESPIEAFKKFRKDEADKCQKIAGVFRSLGLQAAESQFNKISDEIAKRRDPPEDWFLNQVDSNAAAGGEIEQETQAEVEQEMEMTIQTETHIQLEIEKENNIPVVQSGYAGFGAVEPLTKGAVVNLTKGSSISNKSLRSLKENVLFFDDQSIWCSAVFERNLPDHAGKLISPQSVFYSNRKPVKYVLITKDKEGGWSMVISTIHESHQACRDFISSAKSQSALVGISTGKPLMVYKTGADRTDLLPFTNSVDQENFYRLYIQAKLFNGEIEFSTQEEQYALKKWLLSKGVDDFRLYFEQNILAAKPHRFIDNYPKSSIFKIFTELAGTQKMTPEQIDKLYSPLAIPIP